MPETRQKIAPLDAHLNQLEARPQSVVAHGRELAKGERLPFHSHHCAQLVYASKGVMAVTTESAAYVVPPQRAVLMPRNVCHQIDARSAVSMRTLYIESEEFPNLPNEVSVLRVTPLLREMIVAAVSAGASNALGYSFIENQALSGVDRSIERIGIYWYILPI